MKNSGKKKTVVALSGGFDPIHPGHVRMIREAKKHGDYLVVILNNDNWLHAKKGYAFMSENDRKEVLEGIKGVDKVILTKHPKNPKDMSVSAELRKLHPDVFGNGGDRKKDNTPEKTVCQEIGCKMVYNVGSGGKIQSSSWLLAKFAEVAKKKKI
jgi:cytidyltransferase-like protein